MTNSLHFMEARSCTYPPSIVLMQGLEGLMWCVLVASTAWHCNSWLSKHVSGRLIVPWP